MQKIGVAFGVALAAVLAVGAAEFGSALPVWPEGEAETLNSFFTFRGEFDAASGDEVLLRATAGYVYKARLNGEFAAFGPARVTPGFFRLDEWRLSPRTGRNVVEIDVAGYNCPNFYLAKQTPFLQAELVVNGKVVAATGGNDFKAFPTGKLRKTPRYAYQRPYSEVYGRKEASVARMGLPDVRRRLGKADFTGADATGRRDETRGSALPGGRTRRFRLLPPCGA